MKYIFITVVFFLIFSNFSFSQNDSTSYLEFSFGPSMHGTGDTSGYYYGFNYGQSISTKWYFQIGFEGSLNDEPDFLLFYQDQAGNTIDASLHTVTSGFQLAAGLKYNFIQVSNHELGLAILPIFRYQATSLSDSYDTLFPAITDLPFPVRNIIRLDSGRTLAFGGSLRLGYKYFIGNNFYLGANGAIQTDTNGDTLTSYFLTFGKRF
jgi:hypothetical protein